MKYCPECGADVEGLVHRCDCCGASLEPKEFFVCALFDLPECLGFSTLARKMISEIQPKDLSRNIMFLEQIGFSLICYPELMLLDGNIRQRITFYEKEKYASLRLIVDYNKFVLSDSSQKAHLVANAIIQGVHLLEKRLRKSKYSIADIVVHVDHTLSKYILHNN